MRNDSLLTTPLLRVIGMVSLLIWIVSGMALAQSNRPATPTDTIPNLSVLPIDGVERVGPHTGRFDFGKADGLLRPTQIHTFVVRNDGKTPITLVRLQPSCGCTSATAGTGTLFGRKLLPGQKLEVTVTTDLTELQPGVIDKSVGVYVQFHSEPAATLKISVQLEAPVAYTPPALEFGKIAVGSRQTLPLQVAMDRKLIGPDGPPALVCTDPDVTLQLDPTEQKATAPAGDTGKPALFHYTVTLSPPARLGAIRGNIKVVLPPTSPTSIPNLSRERLELEFMELTEPVSGEVIGKIVAAPSAVAFGTVFAGQSVVRRVTVTAASADVWKGLHVLSGSVLISLKLGTAHPAKASGTPQNPDVEGVLELTLRAKPPVGGLNSEVMVSTSDGQRLILPVVAYIAGEAGK